MSEERRIARIRITPEALLGLLRNGKRLVEITSPKPVDAEFRGAFYEELTSEFGIVIESPEFEPVPEATMIPNMPGHIEFRDLPPLGDLRELLAQLSHEQWSAWVTDLIEIIGKILPGELVKKWDRLANTAYEDLTDVEKHDDRFFADRVLALLGLDSWGEVEKKADEAEASPAVKEESRG